MITRWKVSKYMDCPEKVELKWETDYSVCSESGFVRSKGVENKYFEKWEAARSALAKMKRKDIEEAEAELGFAKDVLDHVLRLEEPKEETQ